MPERAEQVTGRPDDGRPNVVAIAPFEEWTYEDVKKAMADQLFEDYSIVERFCVYKDHFQKGTQWVGPGDAVTNKTIQKQFAPEDAIGEVLDNVENAFSEPQIGISPLTETEGDEETARDKGDELLGFLTEWWKSRRMQEHVQERVRTATWAGWADLRIFIPWRFLLRQGDTVTIRQASSFEEALGMIHIKAPLPQNAASLIDQSTQDVVMVFLDTETVYTGGVRKDYSRAEIMYLDPERDLDKEANLIIRIVYGNQEKPSTRAVLKMRGSFLGAEMRARRLITEPVLRTQRQLNLLTTLVTRIAETAAFRERYTINAKPQGLRYPYKDGDTLREGAFLERDEEGRAWEVVPVPRTLGANTTTELVGLPVKDNQGDIKGSEKVEVKIVDPVDPGPYIMAADGVRRRVLRMCGQGHLGGVSNAESSGIAYEQARAVFEKDLEARRVPEEGMLRDLLTSVVKLAEVISSTEGEFTDLIRLTVDQHINPGPRSPDLVRLDLEAYEAGAASLERTVSKMGVEDTDAEIARIKRSAAFILGILEQVSAVQGFTGESMIEVLKALKLPEDILGKLEVQEEPEVVAPVPGNEPGNNDE